MFLAGSVEIRMMTNSKSCKISAGKSTLMHSISGCSGTLNRCSSKTCQHSIFCAVRHPYKWHRMIGMLQWTTQWTRSRVLLCSSHCFDSVENCQLSFAAFRGLLLLVTLDDAPSSADELQHILSLSRPTQKQIARQCWTSDKQRVKLQNKTTSSRSLCYSLDGTVVAKRRAAMRRFSCLFFSPNHFKSFFCLRGCFLNWVVVFGNNERITYWYSADMPVKWHRLHWKLGFRVALEWLVGQRCG